MDKIIASDLYRYVGKSNYFMFLRLLFFTPGFRYIYFFRKAGSSNFLLKFIYKFLMRRCGLKFGFQIPESTKIGLGFRIVHYGPIIINPSTK